MTLTQSPIRCYCDPPADVVVLDDIRDQLTASAFRYLVLNTHHSGSRGLWNLHDRIEELLALHAIEKGGVA